MDTQVLGISTDSKPTQTAFTTALGGIPYPVLGDFHPHGKMAEAYGVFDEERGTANRVVFIIDKEGVVRFKQEYGNVSELDTVEILTEVAKL